MKYLLGVITLGDKRFVRLEEMFKNGKPSGKYKDYKEFNAADCFLTPNERGQLIIETPEADKKTPVKNNDIK